MTALLRPAPNRLDALAVKHIDGHLAVTDTDVWGVYTLGEAPWGYRPDEERESLVRKMGSALSALEGRDIQTRVSTRPVDAEARIKAYDLSVPDPPDLEAFQAQLARARAAMSGLVLPSGVRDGQVETVATFAVRLLHLGTKDTLVSAARRVRHQERGPHAAVKDAAREDAKVQRVLDVPGYRARPATSEEMGWLLLRGVMPGLPVPVVSPHGVWTAEDLAALVEPVTWRRIKGMVHVTSTHTDVESWCQVLTVGRMEEREDWPADGTAPWMAFAAQAAGAVAGVELVASGSVIRGRDLAKTFDDKRKLAEDNITHMEEKGETAPLETVERFHLARNLAREARRGHASQVARVYGVTRIVVTAATRGECEERADRLVHAYRDDLSIDLMRPLDQIDAMRELTVGEKRATDSFQRKLKAVHFAAGVPNVTGKVGDDTGFYLGYTTGAVPGRTVQHDPWAPMEQQNLSGLRTIFADLGSGKTALSARIMYEGVLGGASGVFLDPPGQVAKLCKLPEMAALGATQWDLGSARPGTLEPRRLILPPHRDDFDDPDEYKAMVAQIPAQQRALLVAALMGYLPERLRMKEGTEEDLAQSVLDAKADPWETLRFLKHHGNHNLARYLEGVAEGYGRLIFPDESTPEVDEYDDARLVVITMAGMALPDSDDAPTTYTEENRAALVAVHLATQWLRRFVYVRPRDQRKIMVSDEGYSLGDSTDGRTVGRTLSRDSRKRNLAGYIPTHHPRDVRRLDPSGDVFQSGGFIGRIGKRSVASEALAIHGAPTDVGYEDEIAELRDGEFLMVDSHGRVDRFQHDLEDPFPELFEALDTRPNRKGQR